MEYALRGRRTGGKIFHFMSDSRQITAVIIMLAETAKMINARASLKIKVPISLSVSCEIGLSNILPPSRKEQDTDDNPKEKETY